MNDTVSRKALNDLFKNRLSKVSGYTGNAEDIEDPFHRGKATSYENILYDISAKLPSTESEGEALNQERYDEARTIVEGLNIWSDKKELMRSVIYRADKLEREVISLWAENERLRALVDRKEEALKQIRDLYYDRSGDDGTVARKMADFAIRAIELQPDLWIRPTLRWFAEQMEIVLRANDYKGGWKDCKDSFLWARLEDEIEELRAHFPKVTQADKSIVKEAADVANFAMMIADKARLGEGRKDNEHMPGMRNGT